MRKYPVTTILISSSLLAASCNNGSSGRSASEPTPQQSKDEITLTSAQQAEGLIKTQTITLSNAPEVLRVGGRIVLADDGQILVDKSRHFQRELGQWTDPEAFLKA